MYADKRACIHSKLKYLFLNNLQWCSDKFQKVIKMAGKKKEKIAETITTYVYYSIEILMIISHKREAVMEVRKYLQASEFGYLAVGSSSHGRSTKDSSAVEQSHPNSSLRKEHLDEEKETEDVGMRAKNSCTLDRKLCPGI